MSQTIIGISGKKETGKNTLAKFISIKLAERKIECIELAFANILKDEVAKATGTTRSVVDTNKEIYRPLLQGWGSWRRNSYPDYFITKVFQQILSSEVPVIIITDVRFVNEANYLKQAGAKLIRLTRNTGIEDKDISETNLDNYQFPVKYCNNNTIEKLEEFASLIVKEII